MPELKENKMHAYTTYDWVLLFNLLTNYHSFLLLSLTFLINHNISMTLNDRAKLKTQKFPLSEKNGQINDNETLIFKANITKC